MDNTVDVTIPVDPDIAATLRDTHNREAVGRLISRMLRPRPADDPLIEAIAALKMEVRAAGLTDAEIAAYNAERRTRSSSTHRRCSALRSG